MRKFNTTGLCVPQKHYMVDISGRVATLRAMVEEGDYVCVNRGRQYGKTTILSALEQELANEYEVLSVDFQGISSNDFATETDFARGFSQLLLDKRDYEGLEIPHDAAALLTAIANTSVGTARLADMFRALAIWHGQSARPLVLIIDEVDSATNNQVFLDFLAQLRLQYLKREKRPSYPAFQSVILSGVTDIRHLKVKMRPEGRHRVNSPWNIAIDFRARMSFSADDIAGMLDDYEADHATGMDVGAIAREILDWTGGYPFLVSQLCQIMDEGSLPWSHAGVDTAVRMLLKDDHVSLFESLMGKLEDYPELRESLRGILMRGEEVSYVPYDPAQQQMRMYGFVAERGGKVVIANRIFETLLYDHFLGERQGTRAKAMNDAGSLERSLFVRDGRLDMPAVLEGFRSAYTQVFGPPEQGNRFLEDEGRRYFLLYLKPIINGTGNYYIEAQTREQTRTDVVVDYLGERFVVELKIWRGPRYNEEGERQLLGYLDHFGLDVGYMLSFNFCDRKEPGLRRVVLEDKVVYEETV
jgi:hypothetical protein